MMDAILNQDTMDDKVSLSLNHLSCIDACMRVFYYLTEGDFTGLCRQ